MIIFYSGYGCNRSDPERFLGDRANLMLSFIDSVKKPHPRMRAIKKARKLRRRAGK